MRSCHVFSSSLFIAVIGSDNPKDLDWLPCQDSSTPSTSLWNKLWKRDIDNSTAPLKPPAMLQPFKVLWMEKMVNQPPQWTWCLMKIEIVVEWLDSRRMTCIMKHAYGILGAIRLTGHPCHHYLLMATRAHTVGVLSNFKEQDHTLHQIDAIDHVPLFEGDAPLDDGKYLNRMLRVDRSFYFSYSYHLTASMQRQPERCDRYKWNSYWKETLTRQISSPEVPICLEMIQGFIEQRQFLINHTTAIYVTLIARRSRHFAGVRFLKRGADLHGNVANEIESEQILYTAGGHYTAYVQHRGSVPVAWSQEQQSVAAKPPIVLDGVDPFYERAGRHFARLLNQYSQPIICLNLVKQREKVPRESLLFESMTEALKYLSLVENQELQSISQWNQRNHPLFYYCAYDMAREGKRTGGNVLQFLADFAAKAMQITGIMNSTINGKQCGIVRTNCVDCLDRTNAAQCMLGHAALQHQLAALGVYQMEVDYRLSYDQSAYITRQLDSMYRAHGDTIALQYGGSLLVNTMQSYQRSADGNPNASWQSHSRDMVNSIRRLYSNTFHDAEKQEAIDVFLGLRRPFEREVPVQTPFSLVHYEQWRSWVDPNENKMDICSIPRAKDRLLSFEELFQYKLEQATRDTQSISPFASITNHNRRLPPAPPSIDGPTGENSTFQPASFNVPITVADNGDVDGDWRLHYMNEIVEKLLSPTVSEEEKKEYTRYVNQLDSIQTWHDSCDAERPSSYDRHLTSHTEYAVYEEHVHLPEKFASQLDVDETGSGKHCTSQSLAVYKSFVKWQSIVENGSEKKDKISFYSNYLQVS